MSISTTIPEARVLYKNICLLQALLLTFYSKDVNTVNGWMATEAFLTGGWNGLAKKVALLPGVGCHRLGGG